MITSLRQCKLRMAHEKYCYWKVRREIMEKKLADCIGCKHPWLKELAMRAARREAFYMERVEHLIRS